MEAIGIVAGDVVCIRCIMGTGARKRGGGGREEGVKQKVTLWQLRQRQTQPLEIKIQVSLIRIRRWHEQCDGQIYVSFSGGMDSTVLLHLVRSIYPDAPAICVDALLYPEIRQHVKRTENVTIIRPEKRFKQVIEEYGWPIISKRTAQYIHEVQSAKGDTPTKRLRLTGIRSDGTFVGSMSMIPFKWQYLCNAPFKISDRCCHWLKKKPMAEAVKRFGYPFVGTRVEEAQQREQTYLLYGCNAFNIKRPRSTPLAFWLDSDIWEYVQRYNVPYSDIYDMGYTRTGCFACMFGIHLEREPNRFQRMQGTHPKLWRYCGAIGIPAVLDYIGVSYDKPAQPPLFEYAASGIML